MSLDYELGKIENWEEVCQEDGEYMGKPRRQLSAVTNTLIWATMSIGIGEITAKNWKEFYSRIALIEQLSGTFLYEFNPETELHDVAAPITAEQVKAHVGLTTNVFPKESVAKWSTHIVQNRLDDITRSIEG